MSTLVELLTAVVISFLGISEEKPVEMVKTSVTIECCEPTQEPSSDLLFVSNTLEKINHVILNSFQESIKIEHNGNKNTLL